MIAALEEICRLIVEDFSKNENGQIDNLAHNIDNFLVRSILIDFEDLLLRNGLIGFAVANHQDGTEIMLTFHKTIVITCYNVSRFIDILNDHGIFEEEDIKFSFEGISLLGGKKEDDDRIEKFKNTLNIDDCHFHGHEE